MSNNIFSLVKILVSVCCSGLAFVANRNLSQRVGLFCWALDSGQSEVAIVEILNDAWNLYIDLQGAITEIEIRLLMSILQMLFYVNLYFVG